MVFDLPSYLSNQLKVRLIYLAFNFNLVHGVHIQRSPICSPHRLPPDSTAPEEEIPRLINRKTCPSVTVRSSRGGAVGTASSPQRSIPFGLLSGLSHPSLRQDLLWTG